MAPRPPQMRPPVGAMMPPGPPVGMMQGNANDIFLSFDVFRMPDLIGHIIDINHSTSHI